MNIFFKILLSGAILSISANIFASDKAYLLHPTCNTSVIGDLWPSNEVTLKEKGYRLVESESKDNIKLSVDIAYQQGNEFLKRAFAYVEIHNGNAKLHLRKDCLQFKNHQSSRCVDKVQKIVEDLPRCLHQGWND